MGVSTQIPAPTERVSPSTPTPFSLHADEKGIDIKQWTIRGVEGPIATSAVEERMSNLLGIKLPGMFFDSNSLRLRFTAKLVTTPPDGPQHFELSFTAREALKMVGAADPSIRVRAATCWEGKTRRRDVEVTNIEHASDWTFSTEYTGTMKPSVPTVSVPTTSAATEEQVKTIAAANSLAPIDYDALRNTQLPILYSSHIILFEDELDDNGTASYKFGSDVLVRETSKREAKLDLSWAGVHASVLRDPDLVSQRLPKRSSTLQNIQLVSCT